MKRSLNIRTALSKLFLEQFDFKLLIFSYRPDLYKRQIPRGKNSRLL